MNDYRKQLEEWKKKAFKKVREEHLALAKASREKKEAEQKKRYNDADKPKPIRPEYSKEWLPPHRRKVRKAY